MYIINIGFMPVDAERIPLLRGRDMDSLEIVENAWLRVVNGVFAGWGLSLHI